jgi:hypothetical protein
MNVEHELVTCRWSDGQKTRQNLRNLHFAPTFLTHPASKVSNQKSMAFFIYTLYIAVLPIHGCILPSLPLVMRVQLIPFVL